MSGVTQYAPSVDLDRLSWASTSFKRVSMTVGIRGQCIAARDEHLGWLFHLLHDGPSLRLVAHVEWHDSQPLVRDITPASAAR